MGNLSTIVISIDLARYSFMAENRGPIVAIRNPHGMGFGWANLATGLHGAQTHDLVVGSPALTGVFGYPCYPA